jgi:hypothetical protein
MRNFLFFSSIVIICVLVMLTSGCGSDEPNRAPSISNVTANDNSIEINTAATITCTASDPDGDNLTYNWEADGGSFTQTGANATWTAPEIPGEYTISVSVTDGQATSSSSSISIAVFGGTLLIQTRDGVAAVPLDEDTSLLSSSEDIQFAQNSSFILYDNRGEVEVQGTRIFVFRGQTKWEIDNQGNVISATSTPPGIQLWGCILLPDGRFTSVNNSTDNIFFISSAGLLLGTVPIPEASGPSNQNTEGVYADNSYILSENGNNKLVKVDPTTYQASIFKDLTSLEGWLGSIGYRDDMYYLCQSKKVYKFTEQGDPTLICEVDNGNLTGICVLKDYAYAVINFTGELIKIDLTTGQVAVILSGLNYPEDIAFLPQTLSATL